MTGTRQTPEVHTMFLRLAFRCAFAEEIPDALDELEGLSVDALKNWTQRCGGPTSAAIARLEALAPDQLDDRLPAEWGVREARQELEALKAWARKWHIEVPWVIEHAERTVDLWKGSPQVPLAAIWKSGGGAAYYEPQEVELVIRWDPALPREPVEVSHREEKIIAEIPDEQRPGVKYQTIQPERFEVVVGGASRKAAWDAAREAWKTYATLVEGQYKAAGFMPAKQRTGGGNASIEDRMRWVVLRVVRGMSWAEVGGELGLPRTTVENPVKELIRALGLVSG